MNSDYPAGAFFKHDMVPAKVQRDQRKKKRLANDEEESAKAKERSGGRCEVVWFGKKARKAQRCERPIMPGIHHMIGGWGKRARGISILAEHKQAVCRECHDLITGHVLRRIGSEVPLWTDEYEHQGK